MSKTIDYTAPVELRNDLYTALDEINEDNSYNFSGKELEDAADGLAPILEGEDEITYDRIDKWMASARETRDTLSSHMKVKAVAEFRL